MSSYYYFCATLPSLRHDAAPPFSLEEFLDRASRFLSAGDYAQLQGARLFIPEDGSAPVSSGPTSLLGRYYRWELAMRNELARLRAHRLQKAADKHVRPGEPEWDGAKVAQAAFQADDPLQGELTIERERWAFVESLAVNHHFDMDHLMAYALLLQVQERRARFTAQAGEAGYGTVYRSVLDSADYRDESGEQR
ncbi:MAG TPA: hypothetical protein PK625_04680 [Spirochaetales bacterium]|nr:hypothetical protein [Spirochaetia bacterium]HPE36423.1 hypothetical protein [Spirochaetales bacterium]